MILDQGRIVASGNHHELLQTSPIYQDIYRSQFGTEDPNPLNGDHHDMEQINYE